MLLLLTMWGLELALATGAVASVFESNSEPQAAPRTRVLASSNADNPIQWTAVELQNLAALRSASAESGADLRPWLPRLRQGHRSVFYLSETSRGQKGFALIAQNADGSWVLEEWISASPQGENLFGMAHAIASGIGRSRPENDDLRLIPVGNAMQKGYLDTIPTAPAIAAKQ